MAGWMGDDDDDDNDNDGDDDDDDVLLGPPHAAILNTKKG